MNRPRIFTVHVFRRVGEGFRLHSHHVAGMNSADAEARIKECNGQHLVGRCFITTDDIEDTHGNGCRLYVTSFRPGETLSLDELRRWERAMTQGSYMDGSFEPASFRRFHVQGARKAQASAVASLCEA